RPKVGFRLPESAANGAQLVWRPSFLGEHFFVRPTFVRCIDTFSFVVFVHPIVIVVKIFAFRVGKVLLLVIGEDDNQNCGQLESRIAGMVFVTERHVVVKHAVARVITRNTYRIVVSLEAATCVTCRKVCPFTVANRKELFLRRAIALLAAFGGEVPSDKAKPVLLAQTLCLKGNLHSTGELLALLLSSFANRHSEARSFPSVNAVERCDVFVDLCESAKWANGRLSSLLKIGLPKACSAIVSLWVTN
ncbi:hypothetical protein M514_06824, partial [Trichuris suis]